MGENEYRRDSVKGFLAHQEGNRLIIEGAVFLPDNMNYSDNESVKYMATRAIHTADGLYDLVKKNCDTKKPNSDPESHLEMYLSLAALVCEIYMKSIIYNENSHNGQQVKKHYLDELFGMLPGNIQLRIEEQIEGIGLILPPIKKTFETLRYDFELNHVQGDYLILFEFMEVLKEISHSYPMKETGSISGANGVLHLR